MIRITVELIPKGLEESQRTLATMEVSNDGTGDAVTGNYVGTLYAEYCKDGRHGRVINFNRKNQSVFSLVGAFLKLWGHTKHSPSLMSK